MIGISENQVDHEDCYVRMYACVQTPYVLLQSVHKVRSLVTQHVDFLLCLAFNQVVKLSFPSSLVLVSQTQVLNQTETEQ